MLNCSYKIPILVEESSCLIFFPIKSSLLKDCCWINLNSIKKIEKYYLGLGRKKITIIESKEHNQQKTRSWYLGIKYHKYYVKLS